MAICTILILTYKGKHHLEYLLPTVREAIKNTPDYDVNVLIVDNGFDDETLNYSQQNFPEFEYQYSPVNDYLFSLNPFIEKINSPYFLLLNDDMKLHPDVLNQTIPLLDSDKKLFAITCNIMDWEGDYTTVFVRKLYPKKGWLTSRWDKENTDNQLRYTLYGGAALFRTNTFNQLKGFDPLFRPAYCEDLDIGHRAWQQGNEIVYNPLAILYHREGGTIKDQFTADKLTQNIYKNQILWMLKNAKYPYFLIGFIILLPYRLLTGWLVDKNSYIALLKSLSQMPQALVKRFRTKNKINDKKFMERLGTIYKK